MTASIHALLDGIVDYAGTFPPANLTLSDALSQYLHASAGADAWLLGRMVVPAGSLEELESLMAARVHSKNLSLSVIASPDPMRQLERIHAFNNRMKTTARIVAVEFAPVPIAQIAALGWSAPAVGGRLEMFFEAPFDADMETRLHAIEAVGAAAKVRTGGVAPGVVPSPGGLVRFLSAATDAAVPFKATAGLHHVLRGCYPLTYEAGSETDTMHGFVNLAVAAALIRIGAPAQDAVDALLETSVDAFRFHPGGLAWRDRTIETRDLVETRRQFFRSFGSCSFREPARELAQLSRS
jgi:hypothetical protein